MGVQGQEAALCQLLCQKRSDDLCSFHAYDGIHDHVVQVHMYQCPGDLLGLTDAALDGRQIDIIIGVGMVGGKMAFCDL